MQNISAGFLAGLVATFVLSALMVVKGMMGLMPELDVAAMIGMMMGASVTVGWIVHFMIGTIAWGGGSPAAARSPKASFLAWQHGLA